LLLALLGKGEKGGPIFSLFFFIKKIFEFFFPCFPLVINLVINKPLAESATVREIDRKPKHPVNEEEGANHPNKEVHRQDEDQRYKERSKTAKTMRQTACSASTDGISVSTR